MKSNSNIHGRVKDEVFNFIYEMALRDAVLQKAYSGAKKPLFENAAARKITKKYIDDLLCGKTPDFYKTAVKIEESFRAEGYEFTFGNTQKLINMAAKYIYTASYCSEDYAELREKFRCCHCPMDSIMVESVIDKLKAKTDDKKVQNILKGHENDWRGFLKQPWSKISGDDKKQYEMFQQIVNYLCGEEGLTPIEYDFIIWNAKK